MGKDRAATKRHVLLGAKARTCCFSISSLASWHLLLIQGLSVFVCRCVCDSSFIPVPPRGYNFQVIILTQASSWIPPQSRLTVISSGSGGKPTGDQLNQKLQYPSHHLAVIPSLLSVYQVPGQAWTGHVGSTSESVRHAPPFQNVLNSYLKLPSLRHSSGA